MAELLAEIAGPGKPAESGQAERVSGAPSPVEDAANSQYQLNLQVSARHLEFAAPLPREPD